MSVAAWIRLAVLALVALALLQFVRGASAPGEPHESPALVAHAGDAPRAGGTNHLAGETSPYLLQHARNPVDWYPWGDAAFAKARAEHKPILLSIGYATCHWCHVMAAESFEDAGIARLLNERYVAIKVDREERPDVDAVYMTAVQAMGRGGGWPLTVWLTPDGRPFWGATYLPPRTAEGRVGFLDLLDRLDGAWRSDPARVEAAAADVVRRLGEAVAPIPGAAAPDRTTIVQAVAGLSATFDHDHGGFGAAPKFPRPAALELLLRWHRRTGDADALAMATATLDAMAAGGVRDQIGGGFHRYAVDDAWRTPHFEKMLADNAQLAALYLDAARVAGRADLAAVGFDTLDWMLRELAAPSGGFFSAADADSAGGEGAFYRWTAAELDAALGPDDGAFARAAFGIGDASGIPWRAVGDAELAARDGATPDDVARRRAAVRARLRARRSERPAPAVDRKVVASWNGLALSALARAAQASGDPRWLAAARRTAAVLTGPLRDGDRMRHMIAGGRASGRPVLEDHAFVVAGLLDLWETTAEPRWLEAALALQRGQDAHFAAPDGAWFRTADDAEPLLVRDEPDYDGAEPSGNAIAVRNVLRLWTLTGDERWRTDAERALGALAGVLHADPAGRPALAGDVEFLLDRPPAVVIVAPRGGRGADALRAAVWRQWLPNAALAVVEHGPAQDALARLVPPGADHAPRDGVAAAWICERRVCRLPTTDPTALAAALAVAAPLD